MKHKCDRPDKRTAPSCLATALIRTLVSVALTTTSGQATVWGQSGVSSISFQGLLTDPDGKPMPDGVYDLSFRFWDGPATGATPISPIIAVPEVRTTGGLTSTVIPVEPAWFNGSTRYLGVSVKGGSELLPRLLVTAVPYSLTTHGISVNPPERFKEPIGQARPNERIVIGNTTEDISRIPPLDQALVIGTAKGEGARVGILFDTLSRAGSAIVVSRGLGVEDNSMSFYCMSGGRARPPRLKR